MTHRVSNFQATLIIGTAVLVDGIQFLLTLTVIGSIISAFLFTPAIWLIFYIWFDELRVSYFDKYGATKMLIAFSAIVVELIPFINALPANTLGVTALIIQSRIEDAKEQGKETDPRKLRAMLRYAAQKARRSQLLEAGRIAREARAQRENP